ncbi:MAG: peptide MFS transporter [Pseudomonadota bacterium]
MFREHPPGLKVLFLTEMWERFAYYLMIGILVLYMTDSAKGGLGFDTRRANDVYGWFIALVYLTPFFGGIIADRYLGYRRSVVVGGILLAAGYLGIGLLSGTTAFYSSLAVIIIGNGFFKPNISSIVGRLYEGKDSLKDAGYNIFYMGINIGAFVCNFVAAVLRNRFGWGWAFTAAGVGMLFAVIWFQYGKKHILHGDRRAEEKTAGPEDNLLGLVLRIFLPAIACGLVGYVLARTFGAGSDSAFFTPANTAFFCAIIPVVIYFLGLRRRAASAAEKSRTGALLAIFGVSVVFWMVFHQNGSTLTLWARDHTDREAGVAAPMLRALHMDEQAPPAYWHGAARTRTRTDDSPANAMTLISTELFQSIEPGLIVFLTPLVVLFFAALRKRNKEPSTPAKIAWGLTVTAGSALLMVIASTRIHGGAMRVSPLWLVGTYGLITVGELFLSPMGLSLVSKLAPARVTGVMMGGWFLAMSIGNKMSGVVGGLWERVSLRALFLVNCTSALVASLAIALMVPWIRRVMEQPPDPALAPALALAPDRGQHEGGSSKSYTGL